MRFFLIFFLENELCAMRDFFFYCVFGPLSFFCCQKAKIVAAFGKIFPAEKLSSDFESGFGGLFNPAYLTQCFLRPAKFIPGSGTDRPTVSREGLKFKPSKISSAPPRPCINSLRQLIPLYLYDYDIFSLSQKPIPQYIFKFQLSIA